MKLLFVSYNDKDVIKHANSHVHNIGMILVPGSQTLQSHIMYTDTCMHETAYSYREKYKENSIDMPYF